MKEKHINLQHAMTVGVFLLIGITGLFLLYSTLGSLSPLVGALVALGAISFFGWLIIDHTH